MHGHTGTELFDQKLAHINSINKAIKYNDSIYDTYHHQIFDTLTYIQITSDFVKNRFYHGLSNYSIKDNWIAYLAGHSLWSHFSAIVIPDDILKHNEALCSQQTIVFLDLIRQKNIKYRTVGLGVDEGPGHFLCEVYYNSDWHLYDVTKEPNWLALKTPHKSLNYYLGSKNELYQAYSGKIDSLVFFRIISNIRYGKINEMPAQKMSLFHKITKIITYLLPIIFLLLFIWFYKRRRA
jgi:hypothetical protein